MISIDEPTLRNLLSEVYCVASKKEESDMLVTAEVLEFIRKALLKAPPLTTWNCLSLNRTKYDQPFLTPLLVKLKNDYFELLYRSVSEKVHEAYKSGEEEGWALWFQYYAEALVQWKGEVYDRLCRESFPHPSSKAPFVVKLKQLNHWILETRWADCYEVYREIMQSDLLKNKDKAIIEVILGQIELYRFPNYKDSIKHFENAKKMLPDSARVVRAFAEYYLKLGEYDKGRSYIFNAMSLDNQDTENYQFMGDSYRDEGNTSVAEQWYNDGLNFNFLESSTYSKFLGLCNDEEYFVKNSSGIEKWIEKIAQIEPDSIYTNVLYEAYRSAGNAYFINNQTDQSEKYYRSAINMHPDWIMAYIDLGYVLGASGQNEKADNTFREAMNLDRDCFDLNWNLGWWNGQKGDLDKARDFYLRCLHSKPQWSVSIYEAIEDLYTNHEKFNELIEYYKSVAEEDPTTGNLLRLANSYEKSKQSDRAEEQYKAILELNATDASIWNKLGNLYFNKGDFASAASHYQKAIQNDPSYAIYLNNLALANQRMLDWDKSIDAYSRSLKINPFDVEALSGTGIAYYRKMQYEEARTWYQKAIDATTEAETNKNDTATYRALIGLTYRDEGNFTKAEEEFLKALNLDPDNPDIQNHLGINYYKSKNFKQAAGYFKKVLEKDDTKAVHWENLGLAYEGSDQLKEALSAFEKAISSEPDNFIYYFRKAQIQSKLGDKDGTVETMNAGIIKDPNNPELLKMLKETIKEELLKDPDNPERLKTLGEVEEKMSEYNEALETYKHALAIDPDNEYFNNRAGICCYNLGDNENAIPYYQKAIAANPGLAVYWENLGLSCFQLKKWDDAIEAYEKAILLEPTAQRYNLLGIAYYNSGVQDKAIDNYKKAILFNENDAVLYTNLGLAYDKAGERNEAEKAFLKALAIDPDNSNYHNIIGVFYFSNGDYERSIDHYQKAIQFGKGEEVFFDNLGLAYEASGQWDLALKTYRQGATLYPENELFNNKIVDLCKDANDPGNTNK